MGFILSKFRKKKSTYEILEQLETEITSISKFKANTVVWQKKVVGYLVTYSIVLYLLLALLVYFKLFPAASSRQEQLLLLVPFMVFPVLIWAVRRFLTWWYHRKIIRDDKKLQDLKKKKEKILDEVMEKETYKVAKQILDKFGQNHPGGTRTMPSLSPMINRQVPVVGVGSGGPATASQLTRRAIQSAPLSSSSTTALTVNRSTTLVSTPAVISSPARPGPNPAASTSSLGQQNPSGNSVPPPLPPPGRPLGPGISRGAPGPPLPRPVLPRERGYMDKFVEFLVGDGPANRYALICKQCQSHNGMALREEFEYIAYRCCYCYYWNPARKQRPVAPRLPDQNAISAASDSSGSDVSAPNSLPQSRRNSISAVEGKEEPHQEEKSSSKVPEPTSEKEAKEDQPDDDQEEEVRTDDDQVADSSDIELIDKEEIREDGVINEETSQNDNQKTNSDESGMEIDGN